MLSLKSKTRTGKSETANQQAEQHNIGEARCEIHN